MLPRIVHRNAEEGRKEGTRGIGKKNLIVESRKFLQESRAFFFFFHKVVVGGLEQRWIGRELDSRRFIALVYQGNLLLQRSILLAASSEQHSTSGRTLPPLSPSWSISKTLQWEQMKKLFPPIIRVFTKKKKRIRFLVSYLDSRTFLDYMELIKISDDRKGLRVYRSNFEAFERWGNHKNRRKCSRFQGLRLVPSWRRMSFESLRINYNRRKDFFNALSNFLLEFSSFRSPHTALIREERRDGGDKRWKALWSGTSSAELPYRVCEISVEAES